MASTVVVRVFLLFVISSHVFSINDLESIFVDIDAYDDECFFEYVEEGFLFRVRVQVVEGGFLDIMFIQKFPNGTSQTIDVTSEEFVTVEFDQCGTYEFCLSNKMSTVTVKTVQLVYILRTKEELERLEQVHKARKNNVTQLIDELLEKFKIFAMENELILGRQNVHHAINQNTNSWVTCWSGFECLIILALTLGQVFYIKRYFEVTRII